MAELQAKLAEIRASKQTQPMVAQPAVSSVRMAELKGKLEAIRVEKRAAETNAPKPHAPIEPFKAQTAGQLYGGELVNAIKTNPVINMLAPSTKRFADTLGTARASATGSSQTIDDAHIAEADANSKLAALLKRPDVSEEQKQRIRKMLSGGTNVGTATETLPTLNKTALQVAAEGAGTGVEALQGGTLAGNAAAAKIETAARGGQGFVKSVGQGAGLGALQGAAMGGLSAAQTGENATGIATNAVIGGATGAALGGAVGGVSYGLGQIFKPKLQSDEASAAAKKVAAEIDRANSKLPVAKDMNSSGMGAAL